MFDKLLPNNINIYAISSSKPTQNSGKMFDDKKYKTMIGKLFYLFLFIIIL